MSNPKYKRVLLKLSGECFAPAGQRGLSMPEIVQTAQEIVQLEQMGCEIAVVIGGGNILRGAQFSDKSKAIQETTAHYMGMLATVINVLALQDALESAGCATRLMTAIKMDGVAEHYIGRRARGHLDKRRVVILAAGTGGPFVTTDTAAALRSLELQADALLKATKVDGVYSDDPEKNPHAVFYSSLSYNTVLEKNLRVMDSTAITHCRERKMPILIFNYRTTGNICRAAAGEPIGTLINETGERKGD